jgi:hypothetical protein
VSSWVPDTTAGVSDTTTGGEAESVPALFRGGDRHGRPPGAGRVAEVSDQALDQQALRGAPNWTQLVE